MEYADGTTTEHGSWQNTQSCSFAPEERITQIKVYYNDDGFIVVHGVEIVSSERSCGLFGSNSSANKMTIASGHRLLYISGRKGALLDQVEWNFDYGCKQDVQAFSAPSAGWSGGNGN